MKKIFKPAASLMKNLTYPQKFIFISLVFLLLITGLLSVIILNINQKIELSEAEIPGVEYIKAEMDLLIDVQIHRGLVYGYLNGSHKFKPQIYNSEKDISLDIKKVDEINNKYKNGYWESIKNKWEDIKSESLNPDPQENFRKHTNLISEILFFMGYIELESKLILDPDIGTSAIIIRLPQLIEYLGQSRGLCAGNAARHNLTEEEKIKLLMLSGIFIYTSNDIFNEIKENFKKYRDISNNINSLIQKSKLDIEYFLDDVNNLTTKKITTASPEKYFQSGTIAIESILKIFDSSINAMELIIKNRVNNLKTFKLLLLLTFSLVILTTVYLFTGLYLSITSTISNLKTILNEVANDNLAVKADIKTKDEMADIGLSINKMIESLDESNEIKKTFVTALAHDLKSPIIAEQKVLEVILLEKLGTSLENYKEFLVDIKNTNKELLSLIENILTVYHYESGKFTLNKELTSIEDIINESIRSVKYLTLDENSELIINIEKNLPLVLVDKAEIRRVIINLISNAIKHNPKECQIIVSAKKIENELQVAIQDNGHGIPEKYRSKIFQKYPESKKKTGSGLGLYLTKNIIDAHGGRLWFETEINIGTTFYFTLPA